MTPKTNIRDVEVGNAEVPAERTLNQAVQPGNSITIGDVTSPNPTLWLDMKTLDKPTVQYWVSTSSPTGAGDWTNVIQFCSVLAVRFLQVSPMPSTFGFSNLQYPALEAQALLGMTSLDDQPQWASEQLNGAVIPSSKLVDAYKTRPAERYFGSAPLRTAGR